MFKQLMYRNLADGVTKIRSDFGQWRKDESSIRIPGMRDNQIGRLDPLLAIEENIDVDGTWPARLIANTAGFAFNLETTFQ
jgi:hypothetical protein